MPHGDFTHIEIPADDLERAKRFYGELFGWTSHVSAEEHGGYVVFERDGEPIAGCMKNDGSMGPNMWSVYLASDDAAFVTGLELYIDGGYMAR